MPTPENERREPTISDPGMRRPIPQIKEVPQQRNRIFALTLASVAAFVFCTVLVLAVLFHFFQSHHALAGF